MLIIVLYLKPACQSFVFNYTVAVLCGSLLFTCCVCQHCNKGYYYYYYYYYYYIAPMVSSHHICIIHNRRYAVSLVNRRVLTSIFSSVMTVTSSPLVDLMLALT